MSFSGLILTNEGRNKIAAAVSENNALQFTHVQLGDGISNAPLYNKKELTHIIMEIPITKVTRSEGEVLLECDWNNNQAPKAFYLREIGIIGNGVLCYYDNAGSGNAEYIDPNQLNLKQEKRFRFNLFIHNGVNVETNIASGLYALDEDLQAHIKETNTLIEDIELQITSLVEIGGEPNKIEKIKVNDTEQLVDTTDKSVNIVVPTNVSQLDNDKGYLNNTQVEALVAEGINGFATNVSNDNIINTYKELVDYAAEHAGEAAAMASDIKALKSDIVDKVDKIPGKGLSTHDFTNEYMSYVASFPNAMSSITRQITDLSQNIGGAGKQAGQAYELARDALEMTNELENTKLDKIKNITDWNEARETGFYVGADNVLNSPAPLKFFAVVISLDDTRTIQILYNYVDASVPSGIQVVFTRLGKKVDNGTFVWLPYIDQTKKPNSKDDDGIVSKGNGQTNKVWKTDAGGNPGWRDDANTTYNIVNKTVNGLVPKLPNESTINKFLRQDGTWSAPQVPADETGTWTPKVCYNNAGTLTELSTSEKKGYYVKTGKLVYLKGFVTLSTMFNSDYFYIRNLPVTKNSNAANIDFDTGNACLLSGNTTIPDNLTPYKADRMAFFNANTLWIYKDTDAITTALYFSVVYACY